MSRRQTNYLYLALSVVYVIITIIQSYADGMLPAWLYVSVAMVTVEISIFETMKMTIAAITKVHNMRLKMINHYQRSMVRHIYLLGKFQCTEDEKLECQKILENDKSSREKPKQVNYAKLSDKIISIIDFVEIFVCVGIILITPLKVIPYDLITNKFISAMSLLSFAMMFFTLYVGTIEKSDDIWQEFENDLKTERYYLDIIEKIANNSDKNQTNAP